MSSTSIYTPFKPTYLYIKQHSVTGKLYFGKTSKSHDEMLKYHGSGKHWADHIKKHGKKHIETLWYCLFYDLEECSKFALMFSSQENIVESTDWLNLKPENGLDGATPGHSYTNGSKNGMFGNTHSEAARLKIRAARSKQTLSKSHIEAFKTSSIGVIRSSETKSKMSISRCKYWGRSYKYTSPTNIVYIENNIRLFAREHNLDESILTRMKNKGIIKKAITGPKPSEARENTNGWAIEIINQN